MSGEIEKKSLAVFDFDRTMILDDSDATIINKLGTPPPRTNDEWTPYMENCCFNRGREHTMSLAIFDFDRTMVAEDTAACLVDRLREKQPPPEWEASNHDWTPYMNEVFEHAYSAGLNQDDILAAIGSMRPTPGILELVNCLSSAGWDILVLTDANSVFVKHWLKVHDLEQHITSIITNRAFWRNGRLFIEPCMSQTACGRCPTNLCKSLALAQWCSDRNYQRVVYAGDGRNDFCPAVNLPEDAIVFPRKDYPMHQLIKKSASSGPQVVAKVVPWENAYRILGELFPERGVIQD